MTHLCDDCGRKEGSLVSAGYVRPLPDVAPTYEEWDEYYLCDECFEEIHGKTNE